MLAKAMLAFLTVVRSIRIRGLSEAFTDTSFPSTKVSAVYFMVVGHGSPWNDEKMVWKNK
jgi:hypothetical protein